MSNKKEKGVGSFLKGLVFEEEDTPGSVTSSRGGQRTPPAPAAVRKAPAVSVDEALKYSSSNQSTEVDQGFMDALMGAVEDASSTHYRNFMKQVEALSVVPDINQRYAAALSTSQTAFGITALDVLNALEGRESALTGAQGEFMTELKGRSKAELGALQSEDKQLMDEIAEVRQKLASLESRHTQTQEKITEVNGKLNTARERFEKAFNHVAEQIRSQHSVLRSYLKTGG